MNEPNSPSADPRGGEGPLIGVLDFVDAVNATSGKLAGLLILPSMAILLYEVVLRYLFSAPTVWVNDLAQILFGFYFLLAGAYTLLVGGHVRVDVVFYLVPRRISRLLNLFAYTVILFYLSVLLWIGGGRALDAITYLERAQSSWQPYIWPVIAALPLAAFLLILQSLSLFFRDVLALVRRTD